MKAEDLMSIPKNRYEIYTNQPFEFDKLNNKEQDQIIKLINSLVKFKKHHGDLNKLVTESTKSINKWIKNQI